MKTNIKYNEIKEISKEIVAKSQEIDLLFTNIEEIIDSVESAWNGKDCSEFIKTAKENIKEEKERNKRLSKFGENLEIVSNDYIELDNNFYNEVKKESLGNE